MPAMFATAFFGRRLWLWPGPSGPRWAGTSTASWPSRGCTGRSWAPGPSTWRTCATTSTSGSPISPTVRRPRAAAAAAARTRPPPSAWPAWDAHRAREARRTLPGSGCPTRRTTGGGARRGATLRRTWRTEGVGAGWKRRETRVRAPAETARYNCYATMATFLNVPVPSLTPNGRFK